MKQTFGKRTFWGVICLLTVGTALFFGIWSQEASCRTPTRWVIVQGTVTQLDHPTLGTTNAVGGMLAFRRVGCDGCMIGAKIDANGRYKILVGEGKYEVSSPDPINEVDWLAKDQPRIVDTTKNMTERDVSSVYDFNVILQTPRKTASPN